MLSPKNYFDIAPVFESIVVLTFALTPIVVSTDAATKCDAEYDAAPKSPPSSASAAK